MLTYGMGIGESDWGDLINVINAPPAVIGTGFFPERQVDTIRSETTKAAGGTGQTYRQILPENKSMIETNYWFDLGWIGSPYQDDKAIPVKVAESKQLASSVETKDPIGSGLEWALDTSIKAATLWDEISSAFGKREVIRETPRAGYPEGQDVQHTNDLQSRSAEVIATAKKMFSQYKGLFSIGYEPTEPQPVSGVQHELKPAAIPFGLSPGMIALGLLLLYLVKK